VRQAAEADDPVLVECFRRFEGRALIAAGRGPEAERLFLELSHDSAAASDMAFDAAEAFHLHGNLERAVFWYERGAGPGGSPEGGKSKYEFIKGETLALAESGRYEEALVGIDRFGAAYPEESPNLEAYRQFVRWHQGGKTRPVAVPYHTRSTYLMRYWMLEFTAGAGGDAEAILGHVNDLLQDPSEARAELLSLEGELLARLGHCREGLDDARRAVEQLRRDRAASTIARGHLGPAERRLRRLVQACGPPTPASPATGAVPIAGSRARP
jgi:hypothetical protein